MPTLDVGQVLPYNGFVGEEGTMTTETIRTALAENEGRLQEKMKKLQRIARRLGLPEPRVEVTNRYFKNMNDGNGMVAVIDFMFVGTAPKLDGDWTVLAAVDHYDTGNVVRVNPNYEGDDLGLAAATAECDHCGFNRRRKTTVLLENGVDGTRKRVGLQCVRAFIGYDLPSVWDMWDGADEWGDLMVRTGGGVDAYEFVRMAFALVAVYGFVPRMTDGLPTAQAAMMMLNPVLSKEQQQRVKELGAALTPDVMVKAAADATVAIEWVVGETSTDNFITNLRAALLSGATEKYKFLLAALPVAYERNLKGEEWRREREERKRQLEEAPAVDVPTGRNEIVGTVTTVYSKETDYGTRWVMTVKDDRGFAVWGTVPSSLVNALQEGFRVKFTAAIEPSSDRKNFGFFSRPTGAVILDQPQVVVDEPQDVRVPAGKEEDF